MKVIKIDKKDWAGSLEKLREAYKLFGPVKEKNFHEFKALDAGETPDLNYANTRLSPKSTVFPQSEELMSYSLDESQADHHIMKEAEKDYSPRAAPRDEAV